MLVWKHRIRGPPLPFQVTLVAAVLESQVAQAGLDPGQDVFARQVSFCVVEGVQTGLPRSRMIAFGLGLDAEVAKLYRVRLVRLLSVFRTHAHPSIL